MRVLHVLRTLDPAWGGPVEGVRSISEAIRLFTHGQISVEIACSDAPGAAWLSRWKIPVHALGPGWLSKYGYNPALSEWLNAEVEKFDVIIVNGIWMYHSYAVCKASVNAGVPYVVYVHGALDPWFKQTYQLKHIKKRLYWKVREARVLERAAHVIFTTEEERHLAHDAFQPYRCKERVLPYGTGRPPEIGDKRPDQCFRLHLPELRNDRYLLYLGRLHEKKGIDLLIKAFSDEPLLAGTQLVIAGPGELHTVSNLKLLASTLPARNKIHFVGPIYADMKWAALRGADAFVLPSHSENFGISVAEALACGVPVLISDKVNIWREVESSGAGIVESDSAAGTGCLLRKWTTLPPDKQNAMRLAASKCFENNFLLDRAADKLSRFLAEVSSAAKPQPHTKQVNAR